MTTSLFASARPGAVAAGFAAALWSAAPAAADTELADLVETVSPAVVTVLATEDRGPRMRDERFGFGGPFEEFFRRFGGPDRRPFGGSGRRQGLGSGFVIDAGGLVVTNHHVIEDADDITVRLSDLGDYAAELVGADPETDLALLRIEADQPLPAVALGDSDAVRVGEDVFAVGNPFGLGSTVTSGIVSATERDLRSGPYVDFIQTDAAINRGNSGGPLFNMAGEVIGVNSAIYSPNGGSVGIGFAVASNIVADVVADLRTQGVVDRGWLGIRIQRVTPEIAVALGLDRPRGALVASVIEGGPSDGTLETGDVILTFGGDEVTTSRDLPKLVGRAEPGAAVPVELLRSGRRVNTEIAVGTFDDGRRAARRPAESRRVASEALGATLGALTPEARENIGLEGEVSGVVVTSVRPGGAAAQAGLSVGDVILRVDRRAVATPSELERALSEGGSDNRLLLVNRRGNQLYLGLRLG